MKNMKLAFIIFGIILICPIVMADEQVGVSLSINNIPPKLYDEHLIITNESLNIYFSVQDSNTIADIKKITIILYENNEGKTSIRKYILKGVGTEWYPKPEDSLFPSLFLSREKNFQFFLKERKVLHGIVVVNIAVIDSEENQATCFLTGEDL
jgi:hypothetical protein